MLNSSLDYYKNNNSVALVKSILNNLNTVCIGVVKSVNNTGSVDICLQTEQIFLPTGKPIPNETIFDVPICQMSAGQTAIVKPYAEGDICLVLVSKEGLTELRAQWAKKPGERAQPVAPAEPKWALRNAVALPLTMAVSKDIKHTVNIGQDSLEINWKDASVKIEEEEAVLKVKGTVLSLKENSVEIKTQTVKIDGDVQVNGQISSGTVSLSEHVHPIPSGNTGAPL